MEELLRRYYKGRNLTREEIFSLYNEKSLTIELEELNIKETLENIPVKGYVHIDYNKSHRLVYHKGCCFIYKIANIINAPEYTLQEIIKVKGEYKEKVMIFSKSSIGRLLYGTMVNNTPESVTLVNCVEIDFSRVSLLQDNNLGNFSSEVRYLKDCIISPVMQEVTSFDVIFIFSCSEEVKEYLDNIINQKQNNKELCPQREQ